MTPRQGDAASELSHPAPNPYLSKITGTERRFIRCAKYCRHIHSRRCARTGKSSRSYQRSCVTNERGGPHLRISPLGPRLIPIKWCGDVSPHISRVPCCCAPTGRSGPTGSTRPAETMRQAMKRLVLLLSTLLLIAPAASAAEPQGRPGVIRLLDKCYQTTDLSAGYFGRQIACDDHYKDAEWIAGYEFVFKNRLKSGGLTGKQSDLGSMAGFGGFWGDDASRPVCSVRDGVEQADRAAHRFVQAVCSCRPVRPRQNRQILYLRGCGTVVPAGLLAGFARRPSGTGECRVLLRGPRGRYQRPCHGVVEHNETMTCAWYLVAASSGHPKSDQSAEYYGATTATRNLGTRGRQSWGRLQNCSSAFTTARCRWPDDAVLDQNRTCPYRQAHRRAAKLERAAGAADGSCG